MPNNSSLKNHILDLIKSLSDQEKADLIIDLADICRMNISIYETDDGSNQHVIYTGIPTS